MNAAEITAPVDEFRYDPFSQEAMNNPLPIYRELRDRYPIYYMEEYDTFVLSRFADVWEFLATGDNTFLASEGPIPSPDALRAHNAGDVDDVSINPLAPHAWHGSPVYEQLRQSHGKPFRPGSVRKLEGFVRRITRERLDLLLPRRRFDLTQDYGGIVSASVVCDLLRLPLSEAKYVLDSVNASTLTDPLKGGMNIDHEKLSAIVEPGVRARRAEGWDGSWPLVDGMLDLRIEGRALSDHEIAETLMIVMIGGAETVPKVVAHGLWELQRHPDQLAEVRSDLPRNAATAFKEMVRFCGPAQWFLRTVRKPAVISGQAVRPGQRVMYLVPSAALDEREYGPDAGSFRWNREITRWVNFGHGQHFCIGYHLALLEGRILVEEFLRRVTEFEVDEAAAKRRPSSFQWGWNELPIVIK